jgi:hypothetical protein
VNSFSIDREEMTMAIIKKSEKVKITYDQKKIILKSDTINVEVEMGMSALMQIYASGSGEGKAMYSIKVPDSVTQPEVKAETPTAATAPVPVPVPVPPVTEEDKVPVIVVEEDKVPEVKAESSPSVPVSEPVENIDDIIRESNGEIEPDKVEDAPESSPIVEIEDKDGWETVEEASTEESDSSSDASSDESSAEESEEESTEKKYRGMANKAGWTDTP